MDRILTQRELVIDLSVPAMKLIAGAIERDGFVSLSDSVQCEVDNFRNILLNLIERGVDRHEPTDEELCS
jgi:hypothetical protein